MTETNNLNQTQTGLRVHIVDTEEYFTTSRIIRILVTSVRLLLSFKTLIWIALTFDFAAALGDGMCWTQTSTNPENTYTAY